MNQLLVCIKERAVTDPEAIMLEGAGERLTAHQFYTAIQSFAHSLHRYGIKRLGLLAENSPDWVIADLACQQAGICLVPLPHFFSDTQLLNSIECAGIDALFTDDPVRLRQIVPGDAVQFECGIMCGLTLHAVTTPRGSMLPETTQKITFTSGSTGAPRGVCLNTTQQFRVAQALNNAIRITSPRHLCLLPLSTLLENIGGVYVPLLTGGTVIVPPGAEVGLDGSAGLNIQKMLQALDRHQPTSIILLPQMLVALVATLEEGWTAPESLLFIAVGGGKVSPQLIRFARSAGLPVYEGYGLSETASVACLNRPGCDVPGSVGQPLEHVDVQLENGEVIVQGNTFLGYLDDSANWYPGFVATGDLGYFDEQGFLHISGRKKNLLISSFGRNINPEWVESQLLSHPMLAQCVVFGDARPGCVALLAPADPDCPDRELQAWIDCVNTDLPDYARILAWYRLPEPLNASDGFLTDNGRPCRAQIESRYQPAIDSLYAELQRPNSP